MRYIKFLHSHPTGSLLKKPAFPNCGNQDSREFVTSCRLNANSSNTSTRYAWRWTPTRNIVQADNSFYISPSTAIVPFWFDGIGTLLGFVRRKKSIPLNNFANWYLFMGPTYFEHWGPTSFRTKYEWLTDCNVFCGWPPAFCTKLVCKLQPFYVTFPT